MKKSDSELQHEVLRELEWETCLGEAEIGVAIDRNIVTLSGTVPSEAKRRAAQEAAHRVTGVLDVANNIQVKAPGSGRTDAEIARSVRDALEWDVLVPDRQIRSTVRDGQVLLEGEVDSGKQREDAERAVRDLAGVSGVRNRIEIGPRPVPAAGQRQPGKEVSS